MARIVLTSALVAGPRNRRLRLAEAIEAVVGDAGYTERARAFAGVLAGEDGVAQVCGEVESVIESAS